MERLVRIALRIITVLIILATVVSFSESYHGLFVWALSHQVPWFWSMVWPLMLDTVILVGECSVFVAIHRRWRLRDRFWAWAVTYTGLAVSTLANGGHVASRDWLTHVTNALPPVALMFALTVGLGVLKRTSLASTENREPLLTETFEPVSHPLTEMVPVPTTLTSDDTKTVVEIPERPGEKTMFDLPVIPKDAKIPPDPRRGLNTEEMRVRDMIDADPGISVNKVKNAEGISWAKAERLIRESREARGIK